MTDLDADKDDDELVAGAKSSKRPASRIPSTIDPVASSSNIVMAPDKSCRQKHRRISGQCFAIQARYGAQNDIRSFRMQTGSQWQVGALPLGAMLSPRQHALPVRMV